jgi:hypothetical protein
VRGQALTEFMIMIPIFLMIFSCMYQLSILVIRRMELAMVERETMRYLTVDAEDKKKEKVEEFVKRYASECGLDKESISYTSSNRFISGLDKVDQFSLLQNVTGVSFKLSYDEKLTKVFSAISGKKNITLSTRLATAAGSSFKFNVSEKAREIWEKKTHNNGK